MTEDKRNETPQNHEHNDSAEPENDGKLPWQERAIPIEQAASDAEQPKPYSTKIHVTEEQKTNTLLVEEIIRSEGVAPRAPRKTRISQISTLRIAIALALIIAMIWMTVFDLPEFTFPAVLPETRYIHQVLQTTPPNAPILLSFDYEPGFAGEMDPGATAILSQLLSSNAYLMFVTTNPIGVAVTERVLSLTSENISFQMGDPTQYVNAGYIPGGPTGLYSLATSIRSTLPQSVNGDPIWQQPALEDVHSISDFYSIIVITDSPDTGRAWIEQVGPQLGHTPLLIVASAKTEPILRPYYEAKPKQVQGLMFGLRGAAATENITGISNHASNYWNSFSLTVIVASVILLVGGLVSAISAASKLDT